jgi:hypothetical protein
MLTRIEQPQQRTRPERTSAYIKYEVCVRQGLSSR